MPGVLYQVYNHPALKSFTFFQRFKVTRIRVIVFFLKTTISPSLCHSSDLDLSVLADGLMYSCACAQNKASLV